MNRYEILVSELVFAIEVIGLSTVTQKHLSGHAVLHGSLDLRDHSSVAQIPVPTPSEAKNQLWDSCHLKLSNIRYL